MMSIANPKNRLEREGVTFYREAGPRLTLEEEQRRLAENEKWDQFEAEADEREKPKASSDPTPTKK